MKQNVLKFQSEKEFQEFFSLLSAAEIPDFMPIEGSGGDKGFDGIRGDTAFQAYFPEEKNRTNANYISKINQDLEKVLQSSKELKLNLQNWIFVVPEDLRIEVIAYLNNKSAETNIKCAYWGASKLKELAYKHSHIIDAFPSVFLPHLRNQVEQVRKLINEFKPVKNLEVDIITDKEYDFRKKENEREFHNKVRSGMQQLRARGIGDSSFVQQISIDFQHEASAKNKELQIKKDRSDQAYQYEIDEVNKHFQKEKEKISNLNLRDENDLEFALDEIEKIHQDEVKKISIKYGKEL